MVNDTLTGSKLEEYKDEYKYSLDYLNFRRGHVEVTFKRKSATLGHQGQVIARASYDTRSRLYALNQAEGRAFKSTIPQNEDQLRIQDRRYGHINNDYVRKSVVCTEGLSNKLLNGDATADCAECSQGKVYTASMKSFGKD